MLECQNEEKEWQQFSNYLFYEPVDLQQSDHVVRLSKTNIFETNLAEALKRAGFECACRWVFGPNAEGNALRLYLRLPEEDAEAWKTSPPVQALRSVLETVDAALQEVNFSYGSERRLSFVSEPQVEFLPWDNPVWTKGDMITTKPRLLLSVAP